MFLRVENINYSYNKESILENINFSLEKGEVLFIIGPNGGGKTTLVKIILGIIKPDTGRVMINNLELSKANIKIGYLPQVTTHESINQKKIKLPVYEVIEQGIYKKLNRKEKSGLIEHIARRLDIIEILYKNFNMLSGGQKQKVLLARAIIDNPDLLILDEPNTGLDYTSQTSTFNLIEELKSKGITTIIITHDISLIPQNSAKIACLYKKIHIHERPESLLECPIIGSSIDKGMEFILHGSGKPHRILEKH